MISYRTNMALNLTIIDTPTTCSPRHPQLKHNSNSSIPRAIQHQECCLSYSRSQPEIFPTPALHAQSCAIAHFKEDFRGPNLTPNPNTSSKPNFLFKTPKIAPWQHFETAPPETLDRKAIIVMFLLLTVGFVLQDFLKKYSGIVEDLQDIRCRKADGDKNSNKKVRFQDWSTNMYRRRLGSMSLRIDRLL